MILDRLPYTLQLGVAALLFAVAIATVLGVFAALFHNTWLDGLSMSIAILGVSIPNFWLGLMLISLFAVTLNWLPASGAGTLSHLILPTIALGTAWAALTTRLIRSSMLDVLREDYVRTARSKGQVERKVVTHHALRNALIPVVTYVGAQIPGIVGGAVVTETVFSRPGIGRLLILSISRRDFAVVEGVILMIGVIVVFSNLLVDISYAFLDPQIRYE
ncbi:MAG: ABC transporter permease [Trueperaceae bacterium]